jgi:dipeptidyl aminopeptidase/acylaminoacyl peptidase
MRLLLALLFAMAAACCEPALAAAPHPFGLDDWQRLRSAAPVAVAPDGRTILYSVTFGQAKGPAKTEWFTIFSDGSGRTKLAPPKDFRPLGFVTSARELYGTQGAGVRQLARWTIGTKQARALTALPGGVIRASLAPDGTRFAVLANPVAPDPLAAVRTVVENDRTALYVVPAGGARGAWWCPADDQVVAFAWAHDSTRVALLQQTPKLGHHQVTGSVDVCSATQAVRVTEIPAAASDIAWGQGDTQLGYLSTTTDVLTPDHVWTVPAAGGTPVDRTPDINYSITGLRDDARGHVWISVAAGVQTNAVEIVNGQPVQSYTNANAVGMPVTPELASARQLLAFPVDTTTHPGEVAVATPGHLQTITHESDAQMAGIALGEVVRHEWVAADGTHLEAIVTFPAGWDHKPGKFIVLPHGGPESNDRLVLDGAARMLAGRGFVVMQPQYRGSTGYGSAFLQAIYQRFGDTAYRDVDAATSEAVAQGWADPSRLAIFGWSAGGFMTAWTVTQTQRYKAAIEGAGITEWLSFILTSDVQQTDYDARELSLGAEPFLKYSAVMFSKNVTTPLLILHGEADVRVPTYQGRELFVLLEEEGKTARMVTYPGSPHFPGRWEQRRNVFEEIFRWLDRYDP